MILYTFKRGAVEAARNVGVLSPIDSPTTMYPTGAISELPGILSAATSWVTCNEIWPERLPSDAESAEIHLAIYADHSFSVINDQRGTLQEVGIFSETLYAQPPGPLTWLRPNSAFSVEYLGLRWVVRRESFDSELVRIVEGLGNLAGKPGMQIPTS